VNFHCIRCRALHVAPNDQPGAKGTLQRADSLGIIRGKEDGVVPNIFACQYRQYRIDCFYQQLKGWHLSVAL